jgi:transcriptional antiterminator RfaH
MWIVVKTKPSQEKWAAENVKRQGCKFYLPQYPQMVRVRQKVQEMRGKPLFPSYLFVDTEARSDQWRWLLGTFGVSSVMMRGDKPAPIPLKVIDDLVRRQGEDGLILLPVRQQFHEGQKVRVRNGPFQSYLGLYKGQTAGDRQKVLLDFLGGKVMALIAVDALEAVV